MSGLDDLFRKHLREQNETYLEHAAVAAGVGGRMVLGGLACLVHAAAPFLFITTGSRTIRSLAEHLRTRGKAPTPRQRPARADPALAMADFGAGI